MVSPRNTIFEPNKMIVKEVSYRGRALTIYNDDVKRLNEFTISTSGCWLWRGRSGFGESRIHMAGRSIAASALRYLLERGNIPVGKEVCHKCDNPWCVNPDHLWAGTHQQNATDMALKGRVRGGFHKAYNRN